MSIHGSGEMCVHDDLRITRNHWKSCLVYCTVHCRRLIVNDGCGELARSPQGRGAHAATVRSAQLASLLRQCRNSAASRGVLWRFPCPFRHLLVLGFRAIKSPAAELLGFFNIQVDAFHTWQCWAFRRDGVSVLQVDFMASIHWAVMVSTAQTTCDTQGGNFPANQMMTTSWKRRFSVRAWSHLRRLQKEALRMTICLFHQEGPRYNIPHLSKHSHTSVTNGGYSIPT